MVEDTLAASRTNTISRITTHLTAM